MLIEGLVIYDLSIIYTFLFRISKSGFMLLCLEVDIISLLNDSPFSEAPYKDAAERNAFGGLSLDGFLSQVPLFSFSFLTMHENGRI